MTANNLELAIEKTEGVAMCGMSRPRGLRFRLRGTYIEPKRQVKYLGVIVDRLLGFGDHVQYATAKAEKTANALGRVLPNIGGPPASKRKVLAQVVNSILLYAAPVWSGAMNMERHKKRLLSVQRKMTLRTISAYPTVSTEAALIIAGEIPIHILADERKRIYRRRGNIGESRRLERRASLQMWHEEITRATKGEWTRRIINDTAAWYNRGFGEVDYYITQAMTGHGNFRTYLKRIGKAKTENCIYCEATDTAQHAIFECDRDAEKRRRAEIRIGTPLHPDNIHNITT